MKRFKLYFVVLISVLFFACSTEKNSTGNGPHIDSSGVDISTDFSRPIVAPPVKQIKIAGSPALQEKFKIILEKIEKYRQESYAKEHIAFERQYLNFLNNIQEVGISTITPKGDGITAVPFDSLFLKEKNHLFFSANITKGGVSASAITQESKKGNYLSLDSTFIMGQSIEIAGSVLVHEIVHCYQNENEVNKGNEKEAYQAQVAFLVWCYAGAAAESNFYYGTIDEKVIPKGDYEKFLLYYQNMKK